MTGRKGVAAGRQLILGTAQLGLNYGLANRAGKPDLQRATEIVGTALEGGVDGFDTAAAYGDSEVVLGSILRELGADHARVVTKVRPLTDAERAEPQLARRVIESSVAQSRRRLQRDTIDAVLFHREADAVHIDVLRELSGRGWVDQIGVSCGHAAKTACDLIGARELDVVQLPISALDPRHVVGGTLDAAERLGVQVHVRSVFLQGALLMAEEDLPACLEGIIPSRRALGRIADEAGIGLPELAVRYILGLPGDIRVVLGVDSVAHVHANLSLAGRRRLPDVVRDRITEVALQMPETLLNPEDWVGVAKN